MKLCVFQGTFNPIHNAHLQICEYLHKNSTCDKIHIIPAYKPPHKSYEDMHCHHRLNMAKLAAEGIDYITINEIEFEREITSYTLDTIKELYTKYDVEDKINFIIGTDAFEKIESWYKTDELKELVNFIIFSRTSDTSFNPENLEKLRLKGYNYNLMAMPYIDISSTQIRNKVQQGEPITHLVPQAVEKYIRENELYKH